MKRKKNLLNSENIINQTFVVSREERKKSVFLRNKLILLVYCYRSYLRLYIIKVLPYIFGLVWFYGISTTVGYFMSNPFSFI